MKKKGITALQVAAAYIGTVVGAGFATGQEVLQFFTRFGIWGFVGLGLATVLFVLFGIIVMELGYQLKANSHAEIIRYAGGKLLGHGIDSVITFFLFGALVTMLAGTGAIFKQQFGLPSILGSIFMAFITVLTVLGGFRGIIHAIGYVVPFLLLAVIVISGLSLLAVPFDTGNAPMLPGDNGDNGLISNWLFAAILYVSYNIILSVAVLGPLGHEAGGTRTIRWGALMGGMGLGAGAFLICLTLFCDLAQIADSDVPMLLIARYISGFLEIGYSAVLIAEVYTTAIGSLYGLTARFSNGATTKYWVIGFTVLALLLSGWGFVNLVKYLYPIIGYVGLVLLVCLLIGFCRWKVKEKNAKRQPIK